VKTFYLEPELWGPARSGNSVELRGEEASHMLRSLRLDTGETVQLIDGLGTLGTFEITATAKHAAVLSPLEIQDIPLPHNPVSLALGWTKSLRRSILLEKATELQAAELIFWKAQRSQGKVPDEVKDSWQAKLLAGAKQCGNPRIPELKTCPNGVDDLIAMAKDYEHCYLLWEDQDCESILDFPAVTRPGKVLCVVGPEGGFTDEEAEALRENGFQAMSLGHSVLRWETAALMCLGLFWWGRHHAD